MSGLQDACSIVILIIQYSDYFKPCMWNGTKVSYAVSNIYTKTHEVSLYVMNLKKMVLNEIICSALNS